MNERKIDKINTLAIFIVYICLCIHPPIHITHTFSFSRHYPSAAVIIPNRWTLDKGCWEGTLSNFPRSCRGEGLPEAPGGVNFIFVCKYFRPQLAVPGNFHQTKRAAHALQGNPPSQVLGSPLRRYKLLTWETNVTSACVYTTL